MLKVVVFNAPPRAGKDVAAKHMCNVINTPNNNLTAYHKEFKEELFKICAGVLGISVEEYKYNYDRQTPDKVWWMKDLVSISTSVSMVDSEKKLYSQRDFMIHISENVIKNAFGDDAFGKMMVNSLPSEGIVFISDSGFPKELQPVIDHVGEINVCVVRLYRGSCTFDKDSRNYLTPEMFDCKVNFIDVDNNKSEKVFLSKVEKVLGEWLNEED